MTSRKKGAEQGFTLVELLLVMVILPLVAGAIAVAIITTEKNAGVTKTKLSDSANAQISSQYYVPDVQAAQFTTTTANIASPFSAASPQVCGWNTGTQLLLGLYRPASLASGYLSVGYWLTTVNGSSSIVRYSCNLDANFNATVRAGGTVVLSDDINATAQASATITPPTLATAAANEWAPVTASTTVTAPAAGISIPAPGTFTLPVNWTGGFDLSQPVVVTTTGGALSLSCTGPLITGSTVSGPGTSLTGCSSSSGVAITTVNGSSVSQPASISAINLAVFQPGSSYNFRLDAVPWAFATVGSSGTGGAGIGAPALLTLGGADSVQGGSNAILNVYGNVNINGGSLTCTGGPFVHAFGYGATSTGFFSPTSCATGGPTITQPQAIPDPYASVVASLPFPTLTKNPSGCAPGEYTSVLNCSTLVPGIYRLDQGISNGVSISCPTCTSTGPNPQGVLLYLPKGAPSFSTSGTQTINIPAGLSAGQSSQLFHTTALQGLVVWQDKLNTQTATIRGTSGIGTGFGGTLYFPTAQVSLQGGGTGTNISTGRIISDSLHLAGSGNALISPK